MSEKADGNVWEIDIPAVETASGPSHLRQAPSWIEFMREMDAEWRRYMRDHDSPADRLAAKLDERFRLDF